MISSEFSNKYINVVKHMKAMKDRDVVKKIMIKNIQRNEAQLMWKTWVSVIAEMLVYIDWVRLHSSS